MAQQKSGDSYPTVKALYRKYRPTKLEDVIGQEQVTKLLQNSIKNQSFGHAYLFIGPRGTGKTSVARIFAHAINNFDYQIEDHYLDIIEIDAASNTGVDNIRDLREKAIIAPSTGKYKVYIIDEVHMLTKSAANALLKTLEEPPEHVIFILATTDAHKVPITISSRTQVYTFKLADPAIMQAHLRKIADAEGIKITDDALEIIVRRGGGSFRDSLSILDQASSLSGQDNDEINAETISSAFGLPQSQNITELLKAYQEQDTTKVSTSLKGLLNSGVKPEIIASEIITRIIATPEANLLPLLAKLPDVQPPFAEAKLLLALLEFSAAQVTNIPKSPAPTALPKSAPSPRRTSPAERKAKIINEREETQQTTKEPISATSTADFTWESFLETVHNQSDILYNQLSKITHDFDGQTLHLYPQQKFSKTILEKPNNNQLLLRILPSGIALTIHDVGEATKPQDATISQISAIMGNVQEVNGDSPF